MQSATLHFHSNAAKSSFIVRNKIANTEIISETNASITMVTDEDFSKSAYVYQVTKTI